MGKKRYIVSVRTADDAKAGTNEDVRCQLVGANGETAVCHFDKGDYNDFEQGDADSYIIVNDDVGELSHIVFALTAEGTYAGEVSLSAAVEYKGASAGVQFGHVERWGSQHNSPAWKLASATVFVTELATSDEDMARFFAMRGADHPRVQRLDFTADRWIMPGDVVKISRD